MNRTAQEKFSQAIESIVWSHTLQKSTINIPPLVTDKKEYIEIAYIHLKLKEKVSIKKIAEVIHRIPYPVVLFIIYHDELCLSVALKRINQSDISKLTVDEYIQTEWIDLANPSPVAVEFLASLRTDNLSFENFYHFYQDIANRIIAYQASGYSGCFSVLRTPQRKQTLDKIKVIQEEIVSLRGMMKKETQFNGKVAFNIQLKKANEKLSILKEELS